MAQLNFGRTFKDKNKSGADYEFVIPDMVGLLNAPHIGIKDEIMLPMNIRDNQITFWELGGRNTQYVSSIGTVIADQHDQLPDAIIFSKLNKVPNGKQALVAMKPGYNLYAGKISVRHNELAPKIKIIKLTYSGVDSEISTSDVTFGKFTVSGIFTDYSSAAAHFPCERLIKKLFSKDVVKPYFANGWSISNIENNSDKPEMVKLFSSLMENNSEVTRIDDADIFIDTVEDVIVRLSNKKLSAVFQCIDFKSGMVYVKPMKNVSLLDMINTINLADKLETYAISISDMMSCYNKSILFNSNDIRMLEMAMTYDDKHAINLGNRVFATMRGYKG